MEADQPANPNPTPFESTRIVVSLVFEDESLRDEGENALELELEQIKEATSWEFSYDEVETGPLLRLELEASGPSARTASLRVGAAIETCADELDGFVELWFE